MKAFSCHHFCCTLLALAGLSLPVNGLIVADSSQTKSQRGQSSAVVASLPPIDLRAVVMVKSPFGVISSGVLLEGGKYVLTAAHVVQESIGESYASRGSVEIFSAQECRRSAWGKIQVHPLYQAGGVWDAALVELAEPVPASFAPGYPLASKCGAHDVILKCGWGQGGSVQSGEQGESGTLRIGLNRYEGRVRGDLAKMLGFVSNETPLLAYDFDDATAGSDAMGNFSAKRSDRGQGVWEAMATNGDSGAPTFSLNQQGRWDLIALTVGRKRGDGDRDSRCNSSAGEWGIDLDLTKLAPWLQPIISGESPTKTKQ